MTKQGVKASFLNERHLMINEKRSVGIFAFAAARPARPLGLHNSTTKVATALTMIDFFKGCYAVH